MVTPSMPSPPPQPLPKQVNQPTGGNPQADISPFLAVVRQHPPHQVAYQALGQAPLTYRQLWTQAHALANQLVQQDVQPQDRVGIWLPNSAHWLVALLAIWQCQAVVVPLGWSLTDPERDALCRDAGIRMVVTTSPDQQFALSPTHLPHSLCYEVTPKTLACLVYTSGTTGQPKGVMLTHDNLVVVASANASTILASDADVLMTLSPFAHVYSLVNVILTAWWVGATITTPPESSPTSVAETLQQQAVSVWIGVPCHFAKLPLGLATEPPPEKPFQALRLIHSGAAPLPLPLLKALQTSLGVPVQEGYGLSEIASMGLSNPIQPDCPQLGSIGQPLPGLEAKVVDSLGESIPWWDTASIGELWLRGPSVMLGYWQQPDKTAQKLQDGWLCTGDLVSRDAQGYFYWHGRVDDVINVGGTQVYPRAIEAVLAQHTQVADVAVVAMASPHFAPGLFQLPQAFVVMRQDHHNGTSTDPWPALRAQLRALCRTQLAPHKRPRRYTLVAALPQTPSGKLKRHFLGMLP
jgi:long-chain acyl-CoA synthetase